MNDAWRAPQGVDADETAVRWLGNLARATALTADDRAEICELWTDIHPVLKLRLIGEGGIAQLKIAGHVTDTGVNDRSLLQGLLGLTTTHFEREARLLAVVPTRPAEVIVQRDDLTDTIDWAMLVPALTPIGAIPLGRLDTQMAEAAAAATRNAMRNEAVLLEIGARHPERRVPVLMTQHDGRWYVTGTPSMVIGATSGGHGTDRGDPSGDRSPRNPLPTVPAASLERDLENGD